MGGRPGQDQRTRGSEGAGKGTRSARVYLAPAKPGGMPEAVEFTPGLTDGQYVEVTKGELAEGTKIVVGLATSQAQDAGGLAGMSPFGRRR